MAVKNAEKYLDDTISSIFAQTLFPSEIYIVDNNSDDRTVEIIKSFGPSIKIIENYAGGIAGAFNLAIPMVESEFITFLDGDDIWLPSKSEKQIQYLNENPELDAVCCAILNFTKASEFDSEYQFTRSFAPSRLFTATTFRKRAFEKFGLVNTSVGHFGWLYDWWSRADDSGIRCGVLEEVLFHRRIHENNSWIRNKELGNQTLIDIARENIKRRRSD